MEYEIRKAEAKDTSDAASVMLEAASWLTSAGMPIWRAVDIEPDVIREWIDRGEQYLVFDNGKAIGTFIFRLQHDLVWPESKGEEAAYVHRFAIRRAYAGKGVGNVCIEWAKARASALGRTHLRLDCESARSRLCEIYEKAGFEKRGEVEIDGRMVSRYELPVYDYSAAVDSDGSTLGCH